MMQGLWMRLQTITAQRNILPLHKKRRITNIMNALTHSAKLVCNVRRCLSLTHGVSLRPSLRVRGRRRQTLQTISEVFHFFGVRMEWGTCCEILPILTISNKWLSLTLSLFYCTRSLVLWAECEFVCFSMYNLCNFDRDRDKVNYFRLRMFSTQIGRNHHASLHLMLWSENWEQF